MNLISQIFFAVLITSFTGTLALGIWKKAKDACFKRNPELVCLTLRLSCLLYLVPVGYIWMQLTVREGYIQTEELWQLNFSLTGFLWGFATLAGAGWIVLTGERLLNRIQKYIDQRSIYGGNIPEEDETAIEEFMRVKKKLGIRRNIRLYRNDMLSSPMIRGIFFCSVILPYRSYNKEELSVIFHHELIHYKSHDGFFKMCAACVSMLQHLNPISRDLLELLNDWNEVQCDMRTITAMSDELDAKRYFEVIVDSMREMSQTIDEDYIFSMLCENQSRLERRIDYMEKYTKIKRAAKGTTAFFAFVFVMMSVTTTYAAGSQMAGIHDIIYRNMEVATEETDNVGELEEYYLPASEDDTYDELVYANPELELISPLLDEEELVDFEWKVSPGVRHVSPAFHVEAGQVISVSCSASPSSCLYWLGIQDEWNNIRFVQGASSLAHDFEIEDAGDYRVLVQNRGKVTITANGTYKYYTPEETEEPEE